VKEGSFKGGYRINVKDQMEVRMGKIWSEGSKVRAVMLGGSQIGRLGAEVGQKGKEAVEVEGWVKVKGRLDREEMERVVEKVLEVGKMADKVIVGGPVQGEPNLETCESDISPKPYSRLTIPPPLPPLHICLRTRQYNSM
jgi:hypothetical protein